MAKKRRRPVASESSMVRRRDRATGRFVSAGGTRERVTIQRESTGRIRRSLPSGRVIVRRAAVEGTGNRAGLLADALGKTNVLSGRTTKNAKRVQIYLSGKVTQRVLRKGKRVTRTMTKQFRVDLKPAQPKKSMGNFILAEVMAKLHRANLRAAYPAPVIARWGTTRTSRFVKRKDWNKLQQMHSIKITVRVTK